MKIETWLWAPLVIGVPIIAGLINYRLSSLEDKLNETRYAIRPENQLALKDKQTATYSIPHYSSDPSFPRDGEMWYNTTEKKWKTHYKGRIDEQDENSTIYFLGNTLVDTTTAKDETLTFEDVPNPSTIHEFRFDIIDGSTWEAFVEDGKLVVKLSPQPITESGSGTFHMLPEKK